MKQTVDQMLQQGVAAHKGGNLQEAERLYRAILQSQPAHPDANHNLGLIAVSVNQSAEALPLFILALEANPNTEQFWLSYIKALIREGQFENAKQALREGEEKGVTKEKLKALTQKLVSVKAENNPVQAPSQAEIQKFLNHYQNGQYGDAEKLAISITEQFPEHQFGWKALGAVLMQTNRISETLVSSQKSVQLAPQDAEAHINLGVTLQELGRLDEAEASYTQAIALKSDIAEAHNNLGNTLQELGRLEESEVSVRQAIALKPDFAEARSNLGNTLQKLGRLDEAEASCRQAITLESDYAEAHNNLGITLQQQGRLEEAETSYTQAIALKSDYAEARSNLGDTLQELGRLEEAEASLRQAIALKFDFAEAHNNLGNTLKELGRLGGAEASLRQAIDLKPDYAEAHLNLTSMKKFDSQDEQYSQMQKIYLDENIPEEQRCHINFGLAKACEDLGDFEQALQHYREGNVLRKKLLNYDVSQDIELFNQLKSSYPQIAKTSLDPESLTNRLKPIFIVGMPRSGTTLVEQIISSHAQVTGAGELSFAHQFGASIARGLSAVNADALLNFRDIYLTKLQNISNGNLIITDKMPHNFRYLGLLAAAFPEAKIVHVTRNPAALCWANYKQYFVSKTLGYCYELDDVINYYELYRNLMEFWKNLFGDRFYDVDYELLTVNQEEETRKLIHYLDLNWEEECLSPHQNKRSVSTASSMQVRKKVYQGSSQQWKKYKPFLNGALDYVDNAIEQ
jgi:tetratricopeptide (TPR) repeat protein